MSSDRRGPGNAPPSGGGSGSRGARTLPPQSSSAAEARAAARRAMYRRRRITVAVAAFLVMSLLILGVVLMFKAVESIRTEAAEQEPVSTQEPTAPGPDEDAASGACPTDDVSVAIETDEEEYAEGENPVFTLTVANGHDADCVIDVGESHQELLLRHDDAIVWSSTYCRTEAEEKEVNRMVFAAGGDKDTAFTWNRLPVDEECSQTGDDFPDGEYSLTYSLGDAESEAVSFTLLGPDEEPTDEATDAEDPEDSADEGPTDDATEDADSAE